MIKIRWTIFPILSFAYFRKITRPLSYSPPRAPDLGGPHMSGSSCSAAPESGLGSIGQPARQGSKAIPHPLMIILAPQNRRPSKRLRSRLRKL